MADGFAPVSFGGQGGFAPVYFGPSAPGGSGFWSGLGSDIRNAIFGLPTGVGLLAKDVAHDVLFQSPPSLLVQALMGDQSALGRAFDPNAYDLYKDQVVPTAQAAWQFGQHPLRQIEQGHILFPASLALAAVAPVASRLVAPAITEESINRVIAQATSKAIGEGKTGKAVSDAADAAVQDQFGMSAKQARAKARVTGRYQGPTRYVELRGPSGKVVLGKPLARSGFRAGRQQLVNQGLNRVRIPVRTGRGTWEVPESYYTPVIGGAARAARAIKKGPTTVMLRTINDAKVDEWHARFEKLSANERVAFIERNSNPAQKDFEGHQAMLARSNEPTAQASLRVLQQPQVQKLFTTPSKKMVVAQRFFDRVSKANQDVLLGRGAITPEQILEGEYKRIFVIRGNRLLTKQRAYNWGRSADARIEALTRKLGVSTRQAARAGIPEIRKATEESKRIVNQTARSERLKQRYAEIGPTVEAHHNELSDLKDMLEKASVGELDTNGLARLGLNLPPETSSLEGMGAAFTEAGLRKELGAVQASLGKLDKRTATPGWEERLQQRLANLQETYGVINEKVEGARKRRVGKQIEELKSELKRLRGQASFRQGYEKRIQKINTDLESLRGGALVSRPFQEVRAQVLARLHDMIGPAADRYEKALVRQYKMEQQIDKLLSEEETAALKAGNKKRVAAAREKRIALLQAHRARVESIIDARWRQIMLRQELDRSVGRLTHFDYRLQGEVPTPITIADIRREIQRERRPLPRFVPDITGGEVRDSYWSPQGSIAPQRPGGTVFTDYSGELFRRGQTSMTGDVLTNRFMDSLKWAYNHDLHQAVVEHARPIAKDQNLPAGWEWVRKYRGERIPHERSSAAGALDALSDAFDLTGIPELTARELDPGEIATAANGDRLAVPKQFADQFRGDYRRSSNFLKRMITSFGTVWRRLVLHTRVGWLENNILGNMMLAAIGAAGIDGLKAYVSLIARTRGGAAVARLAGMDATRSALSDEEFQYLFPEQTRPATFVGSTLPPPKVWDTKATTAAQKVWRGGIKASRATLGAFPRADRWFETWLRKGNVLTELRRDPTVKAIFKAQPKGEKSMRDAILQAIEKDPGVRDAASQEVNNALGDFLTMTPAEREVIRNLIPFYGWLREITRIVARLPLNHPLKTALLIQLGQIGSEYDVKNVPSYLLGGFPLGGVSAGGQQTVFSTSSLNPVSSVYQVGQALAPVFTQPSETNLRAFASETNPILAAIMNTAIRPSGSPPLYQIPYQVLAGTPPFRAVFPRTSTLYPTRGLVQSLEQFAGSPLRTFDVAEAANRA